MSLSIQSLCGRGSLVVAVCCVVLMSAACSKSDKKSASQVALKVNGEEVSEHQVNMLMERHAPGVAPDQAEAAARRVVEGLIDQELAAQAARKEGLDKDPRVLQRMEAAKRDVLALAYLDRLGEKVNEPPSDEVDRYYEAHPVLFAQRRLFSMQETALAVDVDRLDALKAKLEATTSLDKMNEALRSESLKSSSRQMSISAEDVPLVLLDQLAAMKEGQSLVLPRDGGARVLTILAIQTAPITRTTAHKLITAFLTKERKRQAAQAGIKGLRDQAKIDYVGRFAPLAHPPVSAASAAQARAASAAEAAGPALRPDAPALDNAASAASAASAQ
jgi:EpsD family peptidyl-prolyl cis-trans isomerase